MLGASAATTDSAAAAAAAAADQRSGLLQAPAASMQLGSG
jgi:hypothetical protein